MTLHMGKTPLKIHGVLPALWLFSLCFGFAGKLLPAIAALCLHEAGHFLAAKWRKIQIDSIEITPYGGVISVRNLAASSPLSAFLLAAAGPLFSLLGCFLAGFMQRRDLFSFQFAQQFARSNLLLLLINLLPALPMDGGRMIRAVLSRFISFSAATRWMIRAGYGIGALLCLLSLIFAFSGTLLFSPAFAGLYLVYAASLENKQGMAHFASSLIARRQRFHDLECMEIKDLAAGRKMPIPRLLSMMRNNKIYRIHAIAEDGIHEDGIITEKELWDALMDGNSQTLEDIIKSRQP